MRHTLLVKTENSDYQFTSTEQPRVYRCFGGWFDKNNFKGEKFQFLYSPDVGRSMRLIRTIKRDGIQCVVKLVTTSHVTEVERIDGNKQN